MCWIRSITRSSSPIPRKRTRSNRGRSAMEGFVATKLAEFDQGKISRRRLIETLTLAATTASTVAEFHREKAKADLIAMGVKNVLDGGLYSLHVNNPFGYDVQISGFENNALTDG